jgi:hypothetical protein
VAKNREYDGRGIFRIVYETYLEAATFQAKAVFAFGHEPLEKKVRGQCTGFPVP